MTRREFMRELNNRLRSISPAERDDVLKYYEEIFEEQGFDIEDEIPNRYDPSKIAREILMNQQANRWEQTPPQKRKNRDGLLLIILGILSLPITFPLAIAFIAVIFALFVIISLLFVSGFIGVIGGFIGISHFITYSPLSAIFFLGTIFIAIGAIILLFNGTRYLIHKIAGLIANKRKPQNMNDIENKGFYENNYNPDEFDTIKFEDGNEKEDE
ncbi:DUF1700 domain-containing protein [Anaerosphaera multitolerans]|uniref:DUF1700 domain-containing protein n=1 Tax=Anaerosphaera multitolerans TaxID=2487351 RepID=A0A437S5H4_9FIRM|nr:DUF1700 domain-containing protein [Anaerosphaera multitolerans]RVU54238.1 DUF1700 domain-containing protein [Anaerosphaera multitolerans]